MGDEFTFRDVEVEDRLMTYIDYGLNISSNCVLRTNQSDVIHVAKSKDWVSEQRFNDPLDTL